MYTGILEYLSSRKVPIGLKKLSEEFKVRSKGKMKHIMDNMEGVKRVSPDSCGSGKYKISVYKLK